MYWFGSSCWFWHRRSYNAFSFPDFCFYVSERRLTSPTSQCGGKGERRQLVRKSFRNWWILLCGHLQFQDLRFCFQSCRYDRQKVMLKEIHNCQYVACMNPMVGSFTINPRLQVGCQVLLSPKEPLITIPKHCRSWFLALFSTNEGSYWTFG